MIQGGHEKRQRDETGVQAVLHGTNAADAAELSGTHTGVIPGTDGEPGSGADRCEKPDKSRSKHDLLFNC